MVILKCDRCGAQIDTGSNAVREFDVLRHNGSFNRVDLCKDCQNSLFYWMSGMEYEADPMRNKEKKSE